MAGSPKWWAVTDWYIDPASTYGGSDANDGLTSSTPIKSIAEWRRRVSGAVYGSPATPTAPTIHVLSASSVQDDGLFYGFQCISQTVFVKLLGSATVIGTGTVTAYTAYSGNTRGSLTDSAIPTSWTASGYVTTTARSRFIRKFGSGARAYAPVALDLGSKSVQLGIATSIDDTVVSFFPSTTEVNFQVGDAYEVVGYLAWPQIECGSSTRVIQQCLDVVTVSGTIPQGAPGSAGARLCGFVGTGTYSNGGSGQAGNHYMCVFCIVQPAGVSMTNAGWFIGTSCFINTLIQMAFTGPDLVAVSAKSVFINTTLNIYKGMAMSISLWRFYDCSQPLFSVQSCSRVGVEGAITGTGNTGKLASVSLGSYLTGASNITAATTDASPWQVAGSNFASPTVDNTTGNGIYS